MLDRIRQSENWRNVSSWQGRPHGASRPRWWPDLRKPLQPEPFTSLATASGWLPRSVARKRALSRTSPLPLRLPTLRVDGLALLGISWLRVDPPTHKGQRPACGRNSPPCSGLFGGPFGAGSWFIPRFSSRIASPRDRAEPEIHPRITYGCFSPRPLRGVGRAPAPGCWQRCEPSPTKAASGAWLQLAASRR